MSILKNKIDKNKLKFFFDKKIKKKKISKTLWITTVIHSAMGVG